MTIGFQASAMPFGKRGLVRNEEPLDSAVSLPVFPPNPTSIQWLICLWKLCKVPAFVLGQGVISLGYHAFLSVVLALAILFIRQDALVHFVDEMTPYWPRLAPARSYMDARGHHQLFLYMSAMSFKDAVLMVLFSLRNIFWVIVVLVQMRSEISLQFRQARRLTGLIPPLFLIYWLDQLYSGPSRSAYVFAYSGIYYAIAGPALVDVVLVFFLFYSPLVLLIPVTKGEGGLYSKFKQMRKFR